MIQRSTVCFLALLFICSAGCSLKGERAGDQEVKSGVLEPESWTLPNGLRVLFIEDRELPLVKGALFIRGGSLYERVDELETVEAMGSLLRKGGAGRWSADALDLELEKLSAQVDSSFGDEYGTVSFSGLSSDFSRILEICSAVALRPRFENERISLWKGQRIEGISRRKESPDTVASLTFREILFRGTPMGRVPVSNDVAAIDQKALRTAHKRFVNPNGAVMAITGNVSSEQVHLLVSQYFGQWRSSSDWPPKLPDLSAQPLKGIYFVEGPFQQATVLMGQLGPRRLTPDYPAISVFNDLFGANGFNSRLVNRVRVQLGFAYSAYGVISPGAVIGQNLIFIQTKPESVVDSIRESLSVMSAMQTHLVENSELEHTKRAIESSFVFRTDTPGKLLERRAMLEILDYPADYDETYISKILAVNAEDVRGVAKSRWDPAEFILVVVGDKSAYNYLVKLGDYPEFHGLGFAGGKLQVERLKFEEKAVLH